MDNSKIIVETQMMVRKPIAQVFEAFINPEITSKFWFTKSTGKLEIGKTVKWEWEMYKAQTEVLTTEIIVNKKICTQWGQPATQVDYEFTELEKDKTYVVIKNYGFTQTGTDLIKIVMDVTGGFTTVLDGLKVYLERDIEANLVLDKFPNVK